MTEICIESELAMIEQNLKVTLVQTDLVWENAEQNREHIEQHIDQITGSDLIILPEMFTTGFSMKPQAIAETMTGPSIQWMKAMAAKKDCAIVGSIIITENQRFYNRLLWVNPDGSVAHYDKKHLFTFAQEDHEYTAGNAPLVVNFKGWKIAAFICYDLRFPVWSRNVNGHYDAAIYIASWPARRSAHWCSLLQARAIENQSYIIGVNRVGQDGNQLDYDGHTMLIDPLGEILLHEMNHEVVKTVHLSLSHVQGVRERFPFLKDADLFVLNNDVLGNDT
ncbi:putative NAD(P)-binding amidase-type enzyme with nitrilase/N-carbamoyl-D-aminoacid amidohydrolase [Xenorhabdus bovienii SS-2004]|uniref:Omega-amidase YafV n=2 Tax=Xenorhabdus bovienii TaxID=40576 RepID=D3V8B0_XENBS|nr:putative NAD(P)-binding amidase-type enzyme with nitrilase/N-carbamoyl-D-aminoacid amidohydrolase [Xenorhabdus bovienii SS-2004]